MKNYLNFQKDHYDNLAESKRETKNIFSCGYNERFDPQMLVKRPEKALFYKNIMKRVLHPGKNYDTLLDVGCGTGFYFPVLMEYFDYLIGTDISNKMLLELQKELIQKNNYQNIDLVNCAGEALPFKDNMFDVVFSIDVIHHLRDIDITIKEMHRVLKPGGFFVIVEPNMLSPVMLLAHAIPKEERKATSRSYSFILKKRFEKCFSEIQVEYINEITSSQSNYIGYTIKTVNAIVNFLRADFLKFRFLMWGKKTTI